MPDFASLKTKIVEKLQTITVNGEIVFDTDAVYGREPKIDDVIVDPIVTVVASNNESDYASTTENRRTYGFMVRVYLERANRGEQKAEDDLAEIIDALIDAFDQDITLGGEALMVEATPSSWGYVSGVKEYRVAEIAIRAKIWFDTTV